MLRNTGQTGYKKLNGFITYIKSQHRNVEWLWIDTCCIDKTNAVELSEAINSITSDVAFSDQDSNARRSRGFDDQFQRSDWFTRGWTLQELVAPKVVVFLTGDWKVIGYKGQRANRGPFRALEPFIASITGIPADVLYDAEELESVKAEDRLSWATARQTTREEDQWYCLYSLLDAPIGAHYGEGVKRARKRLLADLEDSGSIAKGRAAAIALELDTAHKLAKQLSALQVPQTPQADEVRNMRRRTEVIFRNIPFAVKKEDLLQLMLEMGLPPPERIEYRFDHGVFRGEAVASYANGADAATAILSMDGFGVNGRPLKVEFDTNPKQSDQGTDRRCNALIFSDSTQPDEHLEDAGELGDSWKESFGRLRNSGPARGDFVLYPSGDFRTRQEDNLDRVDKGTRELPIPDQPQTQTLRRTHGVFPKVDPTFEAFKRNRAQKRAERLSRFSNEASESITAEHYGPPPSASAYFGRYPQARSMALPPPSGYPETEYVSTFDPPGLKPEPFPRPRGPPPQAPETWPNQRGEFPP